MAFNTQEMNESNKNLLLFLQIIVAFILGVFGNSFSELVKLSSSVTIVGVIALIFISLVLSILQQSINDAQKQGNIIPTDKPYQFTNYIFPISFFGGMVISFAAVKFTDTYGLNYYIHIGGENEKYRFNLWGIYSYELISISLVCLCLFIIKPNLEVKRLFGICLLGLCVGSSSTILYLKPDENDTISTFLGTIIIVFCICSQYRKKKSN